MAPLVDHSRVANLADNPFELCECIREDFEPSGRRITHEQGFYILNESSLCPFDSKEFRYLKRSAVQMPATEESLEKIADAFTAFADKVEVTYLKIRDCADGSIIVYKVKPVPQPRRR
ncbi:MAG: hypothetical protein V4611_01190 [Patescibacteria group bacterium]